MGGIVGFIDDSMSEKDLNRAINSMYHRGSDGRGTFVSEDTVVGLGITELSIMDPTGPSQPFYTKEGSLVLVCNGELYGFESIRDSLIQLGHCFYTRNDSEVILHLYMEYGISFVDHLRGEFSFLLYDKFENIVLAGRDHFGLKPLFYSKTSNGYLFASEAKALFATGKVIPKINVSAVQCILDDIEQETIFEKVLSVPAGHVMLVDIDTGRETFINYCITESNIEDTKDKKSVNDYVKILQDGLDDAVKVRLRSDVPVGLHLYDDGPSSTIAKTVAKYRHSQLKAFNVSFPDYLDVKKNDSVQEVSGATNAHIHSIACDQYSLLTNIEDCLWVIEQPLSKLYAVGMFLLSRNASKHVKVVITSEGMNEVLLKYILPNERTEIDLAPEDEFNTPSFDDSSIVPKKKGDNVLNRLYKKLSLVNTAKLSLLHNNDSNSCNNCIGAGGFQSNTRKEVFHSIEFRAPLLDIQLIEKIQQIPEKFKREVLLKVFSIDIQDKLSFNSRRAKAKELPSLSSKTCDSVLLNRLIEKYLNKDAIERAGIFHFDSVQGMLRAQSTPTLNQAARKKIDKQFILMLTTQIIDQLYIRKFNENLVSRSNGSSKNIVPQQNPLANKNISVA